MDPRNSSHQEEWLTEHKKLDQKKRAKKDKNWFIRLRAYETLGWDEEAKSDVHWKIRLKAYEALGWETNAKKDRISDIRLEAYESLGWEEAAKKDEHWFIRLKAYEALGWETNALEDTNLNIQLRAKIKLSKRGFKLPKTLSSLQYFLFYEVLNEEQQKTFLLKIAKGEFASILNDYLTFLPKRIQFKIKLMRR